MLPYLRPDGKAQVTVRYEVDEHGRQRPVEIERVLDLDAAPRRARRRDADQARPRRARPRSRSCRATSTTRSAARRPRLRLRQPDRQVRDRRPDGRHRPDRPQDHRRHLRRRGAGTAAARSPARIRRRSTARRPTRRATSRRTSSRPGLADRCEVQVAYAIGVAHPVSIAVRDASAPSTIAGRRGSRQLVREHFDLRPAAILRDLDLRRPIYAKTAAYGHFGRDDRDFTWERTDKARHAARGGARRSTAASVRSARERTFTPRYAAAERVRSARSIDHHERRAFAVGTAIRRGVPARMTIDALADR